MYAAVDERHRLWLHVNSLDWLIQYIQDEKESGGVVPVEEKDQAKPAIYWNFRDDSWYARAQTMTGKWLQISRGIKRRMKESNSDWENAKQAVFEEMERWVLAVESGSVTAEQDASAVSEPDLPV